MHSALFFSFRCYLLYIIMANKTGDEAGMTSKDYYFDSYAHFGKCVFVYKSIW